MHLLKNIGNLWLTEKTGELIFFENGHLKVAKWSNLRKLFDLERLGLLKLFDLTEVSIAPKPIERQRVSTCLQVFLEKNPHCSIGPIHHSILESLRTQLHLFTKFCNGGKLLISKRMEQIVEATSNIVLMEQIVEVTSNIVRR